MCCKQSSFVAYSPGWAVVGGVAHYLVYGTRALPNLESSRTGGMWQLMQELLASRATAPDPLPVHTTCAARPHACRAREALRQCLPDLLRNPQFTGCLKSDDTTRRWLAQLLVNVGFTDSAAQLSADVLTPTPLQGQ